MATINFQGGRIILGTEFSGYKYYFYEPGTSTSKTTYKDSSLTVGNENADPVVLDANGAAQIWFTGNADVVLKTSAGVTVYSDDDVNLSPSTTSTGSGNMILNPSFEDDSDGDGVPDNWTDTEYTNGTFVIDTTDSYSGAQCIKFTSVGTGGGYLTSLSSYAVSPSVVYSIGWAMKGTADVRNVVDILWYKLDGTASTTASTNVYDDSTTNPTSWTEKWYEVTSPSDAAFAKIRLTGCHSSDPTTGNTKFDQVYFTDLVHKRSPNTLSKALAQAKGANVATAAVCNIWALADGDTVHLTGTATTTSFGTATQAGCRKDCIVDGTFVMVSGTNMIVPTGTLTAVSNDKFKVYADSVSKMYVFDYMRANGRSLAQWPTEPVCLQTYAMATSTALVITDVITSAYPRYKLEMNNFVLTSNAAYLYANVSTNNGTSYVTSTAYGYSILMNGEVGTTAVVNSTNANILIALSGVAGDISDGAGIGYSGDITLYNPSSSATQKQLRIQSAYYGTEAGMICVDGVGRYNGTAAVNALKIAPSVGNIATGTAKIYGIP